MILSGLQGICSAENTCLEYNYKENKKEITYIGVNNNYAASILTK